MKNFAYKKTSVNWSKSQTAITKLLNQRGTYENQFTNLKDRFVLQFRVIENEIKKPLAVRIVVPIQHDSEDYKMREKELNTLHRVLFYHLKAKFTAIDSGLTELMEEFMPHLVITDKSGKTGTLGQAILPQYEESIESGKQGDIKLLE